MSGEIPGFTPGGLDESKDRNKHMNAFLLWFWGIVVKPVPDRLERDIWSKDIGTSKGDHELNSLPKVLWIAVSPLAIAPFYAAGEHSRRPRRHTIKRVISSYIPTIKALSYGRERKLELELLTQPKPHIILDTMPNTPGAGNRSGVTDEIKDIMARATGKVTFSQLDRPSGMSVVEELRCLMPFILPVMVSQIANVPLTVIYPSETMMDTR